MKLIMYGASDDLVECQGQVTNTDPGDAIASDGAEFNIYSPEDGHFVLSSDKGAKLRIFPKYDDRGCWSFALGLYEEDMALPMIVVSARGHSTQVEIGADDEAWEIFWREGQR